MRRSRLPGQLLTAALLALAIGCASSGSRTVASSGPNLLTRSDIAQQQWPNAYALVEGLRPRWLRVRGPDTLNGDVVEVQVYLDGQRMGAAALLRTIPVHDIERLEYLDGIEASARYGLGHGNGAILLFTRKADS